MASEFSTTAMNGAFRAYQSAQEMPVAKTFETAATKGPSFSDLLRDTAMDAVETVRAGDRAAVAGLQGKLATQDVIEATMAMETALQTSTAIRDKMVEAYQEVLRMSV